MKKIFDFSPENYGSFVYEKKKNPMLFFFDRIFEKAVETRNLEEYLAYMLSEILVLVQADYASVLIFSPIEKNLRVFLSTGHPGQLSSQTMSIDEGISGHVFRSGRPLLITDVTQFPENLKPRIWNPGESFISCPLKTSGRKTGVINLSRFSDVIPFGNYEKKIVSSIQGHLASVLEKQRLTEDVWHKNWQLELLSRLNRLLHAPGDFTKNLNKFCVQMANELELLEIAVFRMSRENEYSASPEIIGSHNLDENSLEPAIAEFKNELIRSSGIKNEFPAFSYGEKPSGLLHLFHLPIKDKKQDPHFLLIRLHKEYHERKAWNGFFSQVKTLVLDLGIAVERELMIRRIHHDQEILLDSAYQNGIYLEISKELTSTLDPRLVLKKAFEKFNKLIGYSSVSILLFDQLSTSYKAIIQPEYKLSEEYLEILKKSLTSVFSEFPADPVLKNTDEIDIEIFNPHHDSKKQIGKITHVLYIPIILENKIRGLIHLARENSPDFSPRDFETTSQFTGIFLTSIKNAMIHQKTEKLAFTDPLTGLYNHRFFQETLLEEFLRAKRYSKPLSLMILDVDHFKKFNDHWGHLIGDKVLIHASSLFQKSLREKIDVLARYGGEEFAIVLPETSIHGGELFAERVRSILEKTPLMYDENELKITVSIGVSSTSVTTFEKPSEMIEAADIALYQAKENGRNQVRTYLGGARASSRRAK
ncbi:MAG: GGDEF domain-containing protein [Candidatus Riflebacteria bacterium]|nr:GGDEF domain-containing protein [Candidatus Riflebacteria bacterium]